MITEDYVSFETAKLLKDKGFPQEYDIYHSMVYNEKDYEDEYETQRMVLETKFVKAGTLSSYPVGVPEPKCYCPTLQMTMKWLREVCNVFISVSIGNHKKDNRDESTPDFVYYFFYITDTKAVYEEEKQCHKEFSTFEEACEGAIKYCLNNII